MLTSRFLLIRHAPHEEVARVLTGRTPGVRLGARGRAEAALLADRLRDQAIDAVVSSPRERALETAELIAARQPNARVQVSEALDEVDFGRWSGRTFTDLQADPLWTQWNEARSTVRAPGGETMADVQSRALSLVRSLADAADMSIIALVTHAEVIRAVACHALKLSLDDWNQIEIPPVSVSVLSSAGGVLLFNPPEMRLTG